MSKSLDNFYCIPDLFEKGFRAEEIRYIMLSAHYRTKVNFTLDKQHEAKVSIRRIQELQSRLEEMDSEVCDGFSTEMEQFNIALENDLDSPNALAVFFEWIRNANSKLDKKAFTESNVSEGLNFIAYFDSIYGILPKAGFAPKDVIDLVGEREDARQNKDWEKSDKIRDQILEKGWIVKDKINGPKLTPK